MPKELISAEMPASPAVTVVVRAPGPRGAGVPLSRRNLLKLGFWTALGAALLSGGVGFLNTLYPRGVAGFGGPVTVLPAAIPKPGAPPLQDFEGHFLLVNLEKDEGRIADDATATEGGLIALWWKCPHLGCTLPWRQDFVSPHDPLGRKGWFACNCHGSTYTKAGVRIYGPAPRSMDTMQIEVGSNGAITVQTAKRQEGGPDNPQRVIPWPPQA